MIRTMAMVLLATGAAGLLGSTPASAGGCGGGGGGYRTGINRFGYGYRARGMGSCGCGGMMMSGMSGMVGMNMTPSVAAPQAQAAAPATRASGAYTCPMHPTVVSATPGACPICGMALVKH
ncbi:MAG TPA: heavy metal-binding domain-containing protein [Isosphaeraceae bacterium]|jgi:hypothetical protein|nr:heavy metal-binding domain-containing protein [Isosphaeraceae bacterium]